MIAAPPLLAATPMAVGADDAPGLPTAVQISFLVSGLFLVGWMVWGVRQYRRTGQATWLWLGALMAISLVGAIARYPR